MVLLLTPSGANKTTPPSPQDCVLFFLPPFVNSSLLGSDVVVYQMETKKPLSLLCWMGITEGTPTPELLDLLDQIFDSQDVAITTHIENDPTAPRLTTHRGLFLFQQVEDKRVLLGSGQWSSSTVCQDWFTNQWPAKFQTELTPHYREEVFELLLMEDLVFPEAAPDDTAALCNASRLEITRWRVALDKTDGFGAAAKALEQKRKENETQSATFGAWRLDDWPPRPDSETVKEYIMVVNCGASETAEDTPLPSCQEEDTCNELSILVDKKHFKKIL